MTLVATFANGSRAPADVAERHHPGAAVWLHSAVCWCGPARGSGEPVHRRGMAVHRRVKPYDDHGVGEVAVFVSSARRRRPGHLRAELLGGNEILLEHNGGRFVANAEAIYSYEGTRKINTGIVGRAITGETAFAEIPLLRCRNALIAEGIPCKDSRGHRRRRGGRRVGCGAVSVDLVDQLTIDQAVGADTTFAALLVVVALAVLIVLPAFGYLLRLTPNRQSGAESEDECSSLKMPASLSRDSCTSTPHNAWRVQAHDEMIRDFGPIEGEPVDRRSAGSAGAPRSRALSGHDPPDRRARRHDRQPVSPQRPHDRPRRMINAGLDRQLAFAQHSFLDRGAGPSRRGYWSTSVRTRELG